MDSEKRKFEICPKCRGPMAAERVVASNGVEVCCLACAVGVENGRRMQETIKIGEKWFRFFEDVGV